MITYSVRLFASLRERTGLELWQHKAPHALTAAALLSAFFDEFPQTAALRQVTRLAVNQSFWRGEGILGSEDELALIPPVSGG